MQQTKIIIFDYFGVFQAVPEECPSEYARQDFGNRRAFAEWLEQNGQVYLYDGDEKVSPYPYYIYEKGSARKDRFFVAIVPVDLSRPWFIHSSGGREKIWYLDKKDEHNMVNPDVQPQVVSYGLGGDTCVVGSEKGETGDLFYI